MVTLKQALQVHYLIHPRISSSVAMSRSPLGVATSVVVP
jgi:hypothetical protein